MTGFWPGEDPWNAFEHNPAWDGAGGPDSDRAPDSCDADIARSGEASHEVTFVQQAIQRVYHP